MAFTYTDAGYRDHRIAGHQQRPARALPGRHAGFLEEFLDPFPGPTGGTTTRARSSEHKAQIVRPHRLPGEAAAGLPHQQPPTVKFQRTRCAPWQRLYRRLRIDAVIQVEPIPVTA